MRGEDYISANRMKITIGSPPHARGRRAGRDANRVVAGITPACAGKTCPRPGQAASMTDHPRMRGEDQLKAHIAKLKEGSPPHARGRRSARRSLSVGRRITPACAGKTPTANVDNHFVMDHPRMRGEDFQSTRVADVSPGSPPHARGRQHPGYEFHSRDRITPACAGKT